jgi:hypothetical protein
MHPICKWLLAGLLCSCANLGQAIDAPAEHYALDDVSRWVEGGSALSCAQTEQELVAYRGDRLKYARPIRVHPAFRTQLAVFETIVDELAHEHFGRSPRRIVHYGAFACRAVRGRPELVSEHALGNALDVAGFDFGPLPKKLQKSSALTKQLKRPFQVRLDKHWNGSGKTAAEAAFLHALAERIVARPDVFRVVLGPGYPGHHNHFHLDHAPYRLVGLQVP